MDTLSNMTSELTRGGVNGSERLHGEGRRQEWQQSLYALFNDI